MVYLMLRSAQRARLEARSALLHRFFLSVDRFPDIRESGYLGQMLAAITLDPRLRDACAEVTRT